MSNFYFRKKILVLEYTKLLIEDTLKIKNLFKRSFLMNLNEKFSVIADDAILCLYERIIFIVIW